MPRIVAIEALYNGNGKHDKIWGAVITLTEDNMYRLTTFDGGRLRVIAQRPRPLVPRLGNINGEYQKLVAQKLSPEHGYSEINWRDPHYRIADLVRSIGTPPDETIVPETAAKTVAVVPLLPVAKKQRPKSDKTITHFVSEGERSF